VSAAHARPTTTTTTTEIATDGRALRDEMSQFREEGETRNRQSRWEAPWPASISFTDRRATPM
jgi:hypothetical protein